MNRRSFIKILTAPAIVASTGVYRPGWCGETRWRSLVDVGGALVPEGAAPIGARMMLNEIPGPYDVPPPTDEEMEAMVEEARAMIEGRWLDHAINVAGWNNTREMMGRPGIVLQDTLFNGSTINTWVD